MVEGAGTSLEIEIHTHQDGRTKSMSRRFGLMLLIVVTAVLQLRRQGRVWWCACRQPTIWSGTTWSMHNSQHLFDPYSVTHILHGIIFTGVFSWLAGATAKGYPPKDWHLPLAFLLEAGWEVVENSERVIQRYRETTASLGYTGDSIANVLGDLVSCVSGVVLAQRLGRRASLLFFLGAEGLLLVWIRDSLVLNVVMLLYPIQRIKQWQLQASPLGPPAH